MSDDRASPDSERSVWTRIGDLWGRLRSRWWARWLIDLGLVAALFFGITWFQSRNLVEPGQRIPEMTLPTTGGEAMTLVDPEAERTLLFLWAPWCGVCTAQAGTVEWARAVIGDDVSTRSLVLDYRDADSARKSAADKGIDVPVLLGDRRIQKTFNVDAFPTFYVLADDGRVLATSRGYTTTLGLWWRAAW